MRNTITKGTKGINGFCFPANEDWSMVVEVLSVEIDYAYVFGRKIFDKGNTVYRANLVTTDRGLTVGSNVVFYRTGKLTTDFICYSSDASTIIVEDESEGFGHEVRMDKDGIYYRPSDSQTLPLIQEDPLSCFHNGKVPFKSGRRYLGIKASNAYIVELQGRGDKKKTLSTVWDGKILDMDIDAQGNLLDLRVASTPVIAAAYNKKVYVYDYETAAWRITHGTLVTTTGVAGASAGALYANVSGLTSTAAYWNAALPWGVLGITGRTKWVAAGTPLFTLSAYWGGNIPVTCYSKAGRIFYLKDSQNIAEWDCIQFPQIVPTIK
jgi:hypothetical protein